MIKQRKENKMGGWIFVDKDKESQGQMRQEMRRNMRGGYRYDGDMSMRGGSYHDGYRQGYKHGWEDSEDDMDEMEYRRRRDSMGRYM